LSSSHLKNNLLSFKSILKFVGDLGAAYRDSKLEALDMVLLVGELDHSQATLAPI
jgi:hypothetical protein